MKNPLTQLKRFYELALERKLTGSDQLAYLHIFNQSSRVGWPEEVKLSDADLMKLMNLRDGANKPFSLEGLRVVKARLKKKGFIDYKSGSGSEVTRYKLLDLVDEVSKEAEVVLSAEVRRCWIENVGELPRGGILYMLKTLEEDYGGQVLIEGINHAACHNSRERLTPAYVYSVVKDLAEKRKVGRSVGTVKASTVGGRPWE